eukprot:gene8776-21550_t
MRQWLENRHNPRHPAGQAYIGGLYDSTMAEQEHASIKSGLPWTANVLCGEEEEGIDETVEEGKDADDEEEVYDDVEESNVEVSKKATKSKKKKTEKEEAVLKDDFV